MTPQQKQKIDRNGNTSLVAAMIASIACGVWLGSFAVFVMAFATFVFLNQSVVGVCRLCGIVFGDEEAKS